jgi:hypothetical protein
MLTAQDVKAITAALDQIKQIVEGAQARQEQAAATAATTGYPTARPLTRQR